jgi:hypothetical protein
MMNFLNSANIALSFEKPSRRVAVRRPDPMPISTLRLTSGKAPAEQAVLRRGKLDIRAGFVLQIAARRSLFEIAGE